MYAPRAAVYEMLPDFLLRLMGSARGCLGSAASTEGPGVPTWVRFSGSMGSYEPQTSVVGGEYGLERVAAEAGLSVPLGENAYGWASVRHVVGVADVSAATGGGAIDAKGTGPTFGVSVGGESNFYAVGCGFLTYYDIDFSSDLRGLLQAGVGGRGYSLGAEAGWRIDLGGNTSLIPRAWVVRPSVSVDDFTDQVNSRVSFSDEVRVIGGLGMAARTAHAIGGGQFSLRGSVDFEQTLHGALTWVTVSGETLHSEWPDNGILAGLDAAYRKGRVLIGAGATAGAALTRNTRDYSGFFKLAIHF